MNQKSVISTTAPWFVESRLGTINDEDIALIHKYGERLVYPKGAYILFDGDLVDAFMYIDSGMARCFVSNDEGLEKTVYRTDMFVAIECFMHEQPIHYNCVAEEDTIIYRVDREYKELLMGRSSIRDMIVDALALKCRMLGWQVADLSLSKPLQRVARILYCWYFDEHADIDRPLLHQDIADMTGLHRVTVTNYINDLRKMGIIEQTKHKSWIVKDQEALRELAFAGEMPE